MRSPHATYRLQLHAGFGFAHARELLPYLAALGVGAVYLSPITTARPGSPHGYDVIDPNVVNPELGGRAGFEELAAEARRLGLAVVVDVVPNHQATTGRNPWWRELLHSGRDGGSGDVFDVDWSGNEGVEPGRVLWPVLPDEPGALAARGELRVEHTTEGPVLRFGDEALPLRGPVRDRPPDEVLDAQPYRLASWRTGTRYVNYRRFFNVTDLAGVRVEEPWVREATHVLFEDLVASGLVQGIRIDHVDGLADPRGYLEWLRARVGETVWLVVEKILAAAEELPASWPVEGSTGYEAGRHIGAVLADRDGRRRLVQRYRADVGGLTFSSVEAASRSHVLHELLAPEWDRVRRALRRLAAELADGPGAERAEGALRALTLGLSVYRTYLEDPSQRATDALVLRKAAERALQAGADDEAVAWIVELLLADHTFDDDATDMAPRADLVRRWEQLTGAAMAKGHEDTACFRWAAFLAQCEVGDDPDDDLVDAVGAYHEGNQRRLGWHPAGMTTTSTHDSKRSDDVRARLAVLSERADAFVDGLAVWRDLLQPGPEISASEIWYSAQTLIAMWPLDDQGWEGLGPRIEEHLRKAMREAKQRSAWEDPDTAHEAAVLRLATASLADEGLLLRQAFDPLLDTVARAGAVNALSSALLRTCAPGVPDLYQGGEAWSLALTDPDNRHPVDFERRRRALDVVDAIDGSRDVAAIAQRWRDGTVKVLVTAAALRARRAAPSLFGEGSYLPMVAKGTASQQVLAFARHDEGHWAVVVTPRCIAGHLGPDDALRTTGWDGTRLLLPPGAPSNWRSQIDPTRRFVAVGGECGAGLDVAALLSADVPVELLREDPLS